MSARSVERQLNYTWMICKMHSFELGRKFRLTTKIHLSFASAQVIPGCCTDFPIPPLNPLPSDPPLPLVPTNEGFRSTPGSGLSQGQRFCKIENNALLCRGLAQKQSTVHSTCPDPKPLPGTPTFSQTLARFSMPFMEPSLPRRTNYKWLLAAPRSWKATRLEPDTRACGQWEPSTQHRVGVRLLLPPTVLALNLLPTPLCCP